MGEIASKDYELHIESGRIPSWNASALNKTPSPYVELFINGASVWQTRRQSRTREPTWEESVPLLGLSTSAQISLTVVHASRGKDKIIGSTETDVRSLLERCQDGAMVSLPMTNKNRQIMATILVKLSETSAKDASKETIARVQSDVEILSKRPVLAKLDDSAGSASDVVQNNGGILGSLGAICTKLNAIVAILDKVAELHPYANLAWQALTAAYRVVNAQVQRDRQLEALVGTLVDLYEFADDLDGLRNKQQSLKKILQAVLDQTTECGIFIRQYITQGFFERMVKQPVLGIGQKMADLQNSLVNLKLALTSSTVAHTAFVSSQTLDIVQDIEYSQYISLLQADGMNATTRTKCLPGTRVDVLKTVTEWLLTSPATANIYWLYGVAGCGKSTIASTIADHFHRLNRLGAFLRFNQNDAVQNKPEATVSRLAYKLASSRPDFRQAIALAVKSNSSMEYNLQDQFGKLILEPLTSIPNLEIQGPLVIVIDALDECGNTDSRRAYLLLDILCDDTSQLPPSIRILITSRPETDIEKAFTRASNVTRKEVPTYDARPGDVDDISLFLRYKLATIKDKWSRKLPDEWPKPEDVETLRARSAGSFAWASIAVKYINNYDPQAQLQTLIGPDLKVAEDSLTALHQIYRFVLLKAGDWKNPRFRENACRILGAIVTSQIPLSDNALDQLLGLEGPQSSSHFLQRLMCLVHWSEGDVVRVMHYSFVEYLVDSKSCGDEDWFINPSQYHMRLAIGSFNSMKRLSFNIFQIESSYASNDEVRDKISGIEDNISEELSYSCQYWATHLDKAPFSEELLSNLRDFLYSRFLYWLEVLSFMSKVGDGIMSMKVAVRWATGKDASLVLFAADAKRFISKFQKPISESLPHIYISALPFSPAKSVVATHFRPQFQNTLQIEHGASASWGFEQIVLEGHTDVVWAVATSPDGQRIASGSQDGTVRVWDVETGAIIGSPMKGHHALVRCVVFSPDGSKVVSCGWDKTIRIWDAKTGEMTCPPLKGHSGEIYSVDVSPDGMKIASGSKDQTILVWDMKTGSVVSGPFIGHTGDVQSVSFSPNNRHIASGSDDETVRWWDAETGVMLCQPSEGHYSLIRFVSYSPDGKLVASGADNCTIYIWDSSNGHMVHGPFGGHTGGIWSVRFSPDSRRVVSGSADSTLRIWDVETEETVKGPLKGHTSGAMSVAWSPDGTYVVSGSWDHTIRVWDAEGETVDDEEEVEGHTRDIQCVAFMPGDKEVVSASDDGTIRMWDAQTGKQICEPFIGHHTLIRCVAVSPDGKYLASGGDDNTVRIWDVQTGTFACDACTTHTQLVWYVAFSPDSKKIASASGDSRICIWSLTGDLLLGPLRGHTDGVTAVSFSPDGSRIASSSWDTTIRIWDVTSGQTIGRILRGHTNIVWTVKFSPDGKYLVSGSQDNTVRLWDPESGLPIGKPLKGHTGLVRCVAISPTGWVASASWDKTIRLWDLKTGQSVGHPLMVHTDTVRSVDFSHDGNRLVSGSTDVTIRLWDIRKPESKPSHVLDNLALDADSGWLFGRDPNCRARARLFWVPRSHRVSAWDPQNTLVIGRKEMKILYGKFCAGCEWTKCRTVEDQR